MENQGRAADTVRVTEVGEELVALHPLPRLCADTVRVTEVGVDLHGRPVCQRAATVMEDDAGRGPMVSQPGLGTSRPGIRLA
jgi:hypothetical protein